MANKYGTGQIKASDSQEPLLKTWHLIAQNQRNLELRKYIVKFNELIVNKKNHKKIGIRVEIIRLGYTGLKKILFRLRLKYY